MEGGKLNTSCGPTGMLEANDSEGERNSSDPTMEEEDEQVGPTAFGVAFLPKG